jgi:hypothetical protein
VLRAAAAARTSIGEIARERAIVNPVRVGSGLRIRDTVDAMAYARLAPILLFVSACSGSGGSGPGSTDTDGSTGATDPSSSMSATGDPCPIGAAMCMCTGGGTCDAGLVCEAGICVPEGMTSMATDPSATTSSATVDDDSTEGSASSADSESGETGEPADLDAWSKRRPVLIANPTDADMVDHQAMIDIDWDDDMATNLVDLRFTDADGVLLPHWIESTLAPVSGRVWVRVPFVPADDETTIFMWYGNPEADDASDGASVFDLWEDFEADLDETLWTSTDDYEIADGLLTITTGAVYSQVPMVELPGLMLEIRARWPAGSIGAATGLIVAEAQGAIGDQDLMSITQDPLHYAGVDGSMTFANDNWTNPPGAPGDQFEWHGVGMGAGLVRFSRTHDYDPAYVWWHDFEEEMPNEYYLWLGHVWGSLGATEETLTTEIDVLLARKFSELPAETSVGGEEDV